MLLRVLSLSGRSGRLAERILLREAPRSHVVVATGEVEWVAESIAGELGVPVATTRSVVEVSGVRFVGTESGVEPHPGDVIVASEPPLGVLDEVAPGKHVGSEEVLELIRVAKPRILYGPPVTPEARGARRVGSTLVIVPGESGWRGRYAVTLIVGRSEFVELKLMPP